MFSVFLPSCCGYVFCLFSGFLFLLKKKGNETSFFSFVFSRECFFLDSAPELIELCCFFFFFSFLRVDDDEAEEEEEEA